MARRIAIVDDDARYFRFVERALSLKDYDCLLLTTPSTETAAHIIASEGCDAALIDIFMYGRAAGFEVITALRRCEGGAKIPVIIASGSPNIRRDASAFLEDPYCDLLPKPFNPDDLLAHLERMLAPAPSLSPTPAPLLVTVNPKAAISV